MFDTKNLEEILKSCGILLRDSNGRIRSFTEVLADINKTRKMLSDMQIKFLYYIMFYYKRDEDTSDNNEDFELTNEEIEILIDILTKLTYVKHQQDDEIKLGDKVQVTNKHHDLYQKIGKVSIIDGLSFAGKTKYLIDFRTTKEQIGYLYGYVGNMKDYYDSYFNNMIWIDEEDINKI